MKGYNSVFSTDSAEESERERTRKTQLGKLARKRFEGMLRALTGTRGELARCMAFSLEHAEAANEVRTLFGTSIALLTSCLGCGHHHCIPCSRQHRCASEGRP